MTLALAVVAAVAVVVGWGHHRRDRPAVARWWLAVAVVLGLVAVFDAFDIGGSLIDIGRSAAYRRRWYRDRRPWQAAALVAVAVGAGAAALWAIVRTWRRHRIDVVMSVAVGAVVTFVALRSVSFHYVDAVLYRRSVGGHLVNSVVEAGLVALAVAGVVLGAVGLDRQSSSPSGLVERRMR